MGSAPVQANSAYLFQRPLPHRPQEVGAEEVDPPGPGGSGGGGGGPAPTAAAAAVAEAEAEEVVVAEGGGGVVVVVRLSQAVQALLLRLYHRFLILDRP